MEEIMEYKGYKGTVEYSDRDSTYFGKVLDIKGLVSYEGRTREELKNDFEGAVDEYIDLLN